MVQLYRSWHSRPHQVWLYHQLRGANGTAKTPTYFNDFGDFITDFDGKGELGSWSATYGTDDLVDDPLNSGRGKVALLAPLSVLDTGGLDAGGNAKYWATAGNDNANDDWSACMARSCRDQGIRSSYPVRHLLS